MAILTLAFKNANAIKYLNTSSILDEILRHNRGAKGA
jgi:hypothetical protein